MNVDQHQKSINHEIDNEWYTFVKDTKTSEQETEEPFQEEESYAETEPISSNESVYKSVKGIDNEWYTFVANDKKCDSETKKIEDSEEIIVKQTKQRTYQCTMRTLLKVTNINL